MNHSSLPVTVSTIHSNSFFNIITNICTLSHQTFPTHHNIARFACSLKPLLFLAISFAQERNINKRDPHATSISADIVTSDISGSPTINRQASIEHPSDNISVTVEQSIEIVQKEQAGQIDSHDQDVSHPEASTKVDNKYGRVSLLKSILSKINLNPEPELKPQKFDYQTYDDYTEPGFHYEKFVNFKGNVLRRQKRDFGATLALGAGVFMLYKGGKWLKRKVFGPAKSKAKSKAAAIKWAEAKKAEEEKKKAGEAKAAEAKKAEEEKKTKEAEEAKAAAAKKAEEEKKAKEAEEAKKASETKKVRCISLHMCLKLSDTNGKRNIKIKQHAKVGDDISVAQNIHIDDSSSDESITIEESEEAKDLEVRKHNSGSIQMEQHVKVGDHIHASQKIHVGENNSEKVKKAFEAKKVKEAEKAKDAADAKAKKTEDAKKAKDVKEVKKAEKAKKVAEHKKAETKKAEEDKKAAEAKAAEAKKAEEDKKAAEAKAAEAKKAEEDKKAAEAKATETKKAEEDKKAAEAKKAEEDKKAAEAKDKKAVEAKAAEAKKAEEDKKAAEAKKAEEDKKAAEAKAAEAKKTEEVAEAKKSKDAIVPKVRCINLYMCIRVSTDNGNIQMEQHAAIGDDVVAAQKLNMVNGGEINAEQSAMIGDYVSAIQRVQIDTKSEEASKVEAIKKAKDAEAAKKADEAKQAEDPKKAEEAKKDDEAKKGKPIFRVGKWLKRKLFGRAKSKVEAEAKKAEQEMKAAEARKATEALKAEEASKAEVTNKETQAKAFEDAKKKAEEDNRLNSLKFGIHQRVHLSNTNVNIHVHQNKAELENKTDASGALAPQTPNSTEIKIQQMIASGIESGVIHLRQDTKVGNLDHASQTINVANNGNVNVEQNLRVGNGVHTAQKVHDVKKTESSLETTKNETSKSLAETTRNDEIKNDVKAEEVKKTEDANKDSSNSSKTKLHCISIYMCIKVSDAYGNIHIEQDVRAES